MCLHTFCHFTSIHIHLSNMLMQFSSQFLVGSCVLFLFCSFFFLFYYYYFFLLFYAECVVTLQVSELGFDFSLKMKLSNFSTPISNLFSIEYHVHI